MIGTVTYALKAKDILRHNGIKAYVERKSVNIGKYGCGYSVVIKDNIETAKTILADSGIKILDIKYEAAR